MIPGCEFLMKNIENNQLAIVGAVGARGEDTVLLSHCQVIGGVRI